MKPHNAARQSIVSRLREHAIAAPPLPEIDSSKLTKFDDPIATFCDLLSAVGGQPHQVAGIAEVEEMLTSLAEFESASCTASLVDRLPIGNFNPASVTDPHELESLDWMSVPGEFMVAENGAIWIDGRHLPHRVLLFITQYLAVVVPRSAIVHHMHEAYQRISSPPGFGVFVAGPSKTADIEQSLVLGAHGCRNLHVFIVPDGFDEVPD